MPLRKFRPDIEGLRAIAIILVVLVHAGFYVPGGFVGVDIFFVISGFLITKHLFDEAKDSGSISLKRFYARRILRIFPASIAVLLLTLVASYLWLSPLQWISNAYDALFSAFSGINYRLAYTGTDYFNVATIPSPFQHYWSLAIEEQFYLVWPLIILILVKIKGVRANLQSVLSVVLVAIIAISLYLSITQTQVSAIWAYFGLHTRAWELALGAVVAINLNLFAKVSEKIGSPLSWLGIGGIVASVVLINEQTPFPGTWALLPTLATTAVVIAGIHKTKYSFESIASNSVIQWIGKISFSWYLIHWPLFVIMLLAKDGQVQNSDRLVAVALSFLLANLSYFLIENPVRFNPAFKASFKKTYALGFSLLLIAIISSGTAIYVRTKANEKIQEKQKTIELVKGESELIKTIDESRRIKALSDTISLENAAKDGYPRNCIASQAVIQAEDKKCILGDLSSNKNIVLFGDSHAHQWTKTIDNISANNGYKLIVYTKSGCPIADIAHTDPTLKRDYTECYSWRKEAVSKIENLKPEIIIISSIVYQKSTSESYTALIKKLQNISKKVVVIADTPNPNFAIKNSIPACLIKNTQDIQKCSIDKSKGVYSKEIKDRELKVAENLNVYVVEPIDWLCYENNCPPVINNIVVYWDDSHVSNTYANYLTNVFEAKLKPILEN